MDLELRPYKSPSSFSLAIDVSGKIYLVARHGLGHDDLEGVLHELGHVLDFSLTSVNLPLGAAPLA